jgi:hypothetical protein
MLPYLAAVAPETSTPARAESQNPIRNRNRTSDPAKQRLPCTAIAPRSQPIATRHGVRSGEAVAGDDVGTLSALSPS